MLANTWAEVFRDGEDDALGDPVTATDPVAGLERVPLSITERSQRIYDAESDELRTVRFGIGRPVDTSIDIRKDDRLHDLRSDEWWAVREVVNRTVAGMTGLRSVFFDLRAS